MADMKHRIIKNRHDLKERMCITYYYQFVTGDVLRMQSIMRCWIDRLNLPEREVSSRVKYIGSGKYRISRREKEVFELLKETLL